MMAVIIRLQNLPLSANASSIRSFFQGLKIPDGGVNIVGGDNGDAFIAFATDDDARQAMHLNGLTINGSIIRLLLSSKQEMQTIITEAQNRVLKRSVAATPPPENVNSNDKPGISYFYSASSQENVDNNHINNKVRIIDHFVPVHNKENNLSLETSRGNEIQSVPVNDGQPGYRYDTPEYFEYTSNYNQCQPSFDPNIRREPSITSNNFFGSDEYHKETEYRRSFLPRPPVPNGPPVFRGGRFPHGRPPFNRDPMFREDQSQLQNYPTRFEGPPMNQFHLSELGGPRMNRPFYPSPQGPPGFNRHSNTQHNYLPRPRWPQENREPDTPTYSSCLVRLVLPPAAIAPKTIFDMFRNISIVPKHGIRIEVDEDKRLTGYVYVLLVSTLDTMRAMQLNNKDFKGIKISIETMPDSEFEKVVDRISNFVDNTGKPIFERSPYYRDLCVEISNIPVDITERDLKDYLNISINNKNLHFLEQSGSGYCLIIANDEEMMVNILKFNGVSYRGSVIKVLAISKHQLQSYLINRRNGRSQSSVSNSDGKQSLESQINTMKCAKFVNLPEKTDAGVLCKLFLPNVIPLHNITVQGSEGVVDFISPPMCKKIVNELKNRNDYSFTVTPITYVEYRSLKANYLNVPGGHNSVSNPENHLSNQPKLRPGTPECEVRIKNFPRSINSMQIKDLITNFEYQPRSIHIRYENGRNMGEAFLTFKNSTEAVEFKDEFHGVWFMQNKLEVLLSEK